MGFVDFAKKTTDDVLREQHTTKDGLTDPEVLARRAIAGYNALTASETHWWNILIRQLTSPFLYLLIAAALLALFLGEHIDGIMILLFVTVNTLLGFYQEYKSDKTLSLLRQYVVSKTKVMRDGKEMVIPSKELVPGDIIILGPGDVVSADVRLLEVDDLSIDESVLTGESLHVRKISEVIDKPIHEPYEAKNMCFSGTTVMSGGATAIVVGTGKQTALGEITKLTVETKHESGFEKGVGRFSKFILQLVLVTLVLLFVTNIAIKGTSANIPELLIFSIALAVSVIPEALPVVMTFSLSRGALHLAKHHVIVKRLSAIEDLGSIEVLCTDKTGTITENSLTVSAVYPEKSDAVLYGSLATELLEETTNPTDSFDIALMKGLSEEKKKIFKSFDRIKEAPFDPIRKRNSVLVKLNPKSEARYSNLLIVRGAAETVLGLCNDLPAKEKEKLFVWIRSEGEKGQRVLAIAKKLVDKTQTDDIEKYEKELHFVGLVSFVDPLKKTAPEAIKTAKFLGVSIKILTGDSKEVAGSVARQIGLITDQKQVITGEEFEALPSHQQHAAVQSYSVFARVSPEQKHKVIQLLKQTQEVGFIGDGINDAPALKAANVAMVVDTASDIAKESADIILLAKSLHIIIDGIKEGREIFANTAKYIRATLASNFGNFYTVAITSLFINFLPLLPLQILLLNLLTDFPMIAVATDTVDAQELRRPRSYDIKDIALLATLLGIVSSFFDFIFFVLFYKISPQVLQTNWFIGSALTELVFLFSIRTRFFMFKAKRVSNTLIVLSLFAYLTACIIPFTQFGHKLFMFQSPTPLHFALIIFIVFLYLIASESVKLFYYRFEKGKVRSLDGL